MDILQAIVDFITGEIFSDVTKVFGLVAFIGLILQRKRIEEIFTGAV